jgi:hypothetical protein
VGQEAGQRAVAGGTERRLGGGVRAQALLAEQRDAQVDQPGDVVRGCAADAVGKRVGGWRR